MNNDGGPPSGHHHITRVVIDQTDHCNSCGDAGRGRVGVSFGYQRPIICSECLEQAKRAMLAFPGALRRQ